MARLALALARLPRFAARRTRVRAGERTGSGGEPLPLPSVEYLARLQRLRAALAAGTLVAVTSVIAMAYGVLTVVAVGAPVLAWAAVVTFVVMLRTGRALALAACNDATAEVRYDHVDISARGRHTVLRASPRLVLRAREHALPRATL
jgi:hypothetical protein